jgi:hypothetical protein
MQSPSKDIKWWQNLWLGLWGDSMVGVGIVGDYEDLRPLVQHYGPNASDIFFPFPAKLGRRPRKGRGQLLIVFTRQGIQRAASEAQVPMNAMTRDQQAIYGTH